MTALLLKPNIVGVYVGYPSGTYEANLSQYVATVGVAPAYIDLFIDDSQPISQWVHGSQTEAARLSTSTYGASVIPVVSVPLISTTSNGLTELQNFAAITSGADDGTWLGIVQGYEAQGYTTIDLRLGEEQNGNWFPWSISTTAEAQAYIAAFDHISALVHNVAGITVNVIWNPSAVTTSAIPTADTYPGNAYVDMIGIDSYDFVYPLSLYDWSTHKVDATLAQWEANPVNLEHYWSYPDATASSPTGTGAGFGLADAIALAKANGKPLALPEVGAGGSSASPSADDALFPQYLATTLLSSGVTIAFADIWDSGAYTFSGGSKPNEAAAWAAFVKALNPSDPGPSASAGSVTVGHGQTVNLGSQVAALIIPGLTGDTETITAVSASLGTVTLGSGGAITYKAPASGVDILSYTVTDQLGDAGTFTDTITIDPGPTGGGGSLTIGHGQTIDLTSQLLALIKPGLSGDAETITAITSNLGAVTLGASGTVTYKAPASGAGTLTYTVTDQVGDKASFSTAIVTDPGPKIVAGSAVVAQGATVALGTAINALITPGLAGDTETITAVSAAAGVATLGANGAITYTAPATAVTAKDTLTYTVADQYGDTATGSYAVLVSPVMISGDTYLLGPAYPSWGVPQSGVTVSLINAAGAVVATTVSNAGGWYVFRSLSFGAYQLQFTPVAGELLSPNGIANAATGLTAAFTLAPGQSYALPNANFVQAAAITGSMLLAGAALPGAAVSLLNASGSVVATTTTSSTGAFTFNNLQAGSYQVQYTPPAHDLLVAGGPASIATGLTAAVTLTAGQTVSLAAETLTPAPATLSGSVVYAGSGQAGVSVALVNAASTVVATTTTSSTGSFSFTGVTVGAYQVQYTAPAKEVLQAGPADPTTGLTSAITLTAGQTLTLAAETLAPAPATLSGGVVYAGSGQAGVSVALVDASGTVVATTMTNSAGAFTFNSVSAGAYQVQYTAPANEVLQAGPADPTTGVTSTITLTAGQTLTLAAETLAPAPATLSGSVIYAGAGQAGVSVALLNTAGSVVATTTTGSTGAFSFASVSAGSYQVQYTAPANEVLQAGPADSATGLTSAVSLAAGQTLTLAAETLAPAVGALTGSVLYGAAGQAGVAIALLNTAGATVATTATGSTGAFSFSNVPVGSYQVQYIAPAGEAPNATGPANTLTGLTSAVTVTANTVLSLGAETLIPAYGTLQGKVYHFGSADPSWGSPQSGVGVALVNAAGVTVATTVSNGVSGWFTFTHVADGAYSYVYTLPAGEAFQAGGPVNAATGVSTSFVVTAGSNQYTPTVNVVSSSNSFALNGAGAIALRGDGNYTVTGNASGGVLTLGNGNDSVNLTGGGDTITVGAGNSTITALGANNLITVGAGMSFITADGSAGNKFVTLAAGQGLETISGFTPGDVLGLSRTLAGLKVASDLSNLGSYVTSVTTGGDTTLLVTPNGSGSASAFAQLTGVKTTVAALISGRNISLT